MHRPVSYTKSNSLQRRDGEEFTDEYSEEIGSMSGRCIDIGCGTCDVTTDFILPKLKPKSTMICADISEAMLNYAKESYGHDDRLSFIKLDIETPDLSRDLLEQFDHVTSLCSIHWCLDLHQPVRNIYSLLRPGGSAFITFIASFPSLDAFTLLAAMPKYQIYMKDAHRIIPQLQHVERPRQIVKTMLTDAGFKVRNCSCRLMRYVFDTTDQFKNFLFALSPHETERMSIDLYGEYEKDLMREALKHGIVFNKDSDGKNEPSILLTYRVFVVYAEKPSVN